MESLIQIGSNQKIGSVIQNFGVVAKPNVCKQICCYASVGSGYAADWLGTNSLVLFLISSPSADDIVNRRAMSGKAGHSFHQTYISPLGYKQEDYGVCSVVRCRVNGNGGKSAKAGQWPTGSAKTGAVQACRYYDREIIGKFNPDVYILAQSLKSTYEEPAFIRLLQRDISKAFEFARKGYRPIVCMGNEAGEIIAPYIVGAGAVKSWRGHWQEIPEWPFLSAPPAARKPSLTFSPTSY